MRDMLARARFTAALLDSRWVEQRRAEIVALPLSGGDGVADDGGRDRSSKERHLAPAGRPSQTKASLDDGPGGQKY